MRELFSIKCHGTIISNEKEGLYLLTDYDANTSTVLDSNGNRTNRPFSVSDDTAAEPEIEINDSTKCGPPANGFYPYTTHEYYCDSDGEYGCFGIKRTDGEKLTEECFPL